MSMSDMPEHAVPLPAERPLEVVRVHEDRNGTPWLTVSGFLFLTFNSGIAVNRSSDDYMVIALVAFSYIDLLMLFYYLQWYERAAVQSQRRGHMKMAIWVLTTLLMAMFSYKLVTVMPLPAAVLIWATAGAAAWGFYAFFVDQEVGILVRSRALLPRSAPVSSSGAGEDNEALLERAHENLPVPNRSDDHSVPWLTIIGFLFLTFNSGIAVYRSNGDNGAIAFLGFSYLDLLALFYCLRLYERTTPESPRREYLKMAVWLLTTMLTAANVAAAIMPLPVQVLVWAMAGATALGGFYTRRDSAG